MQVNGSYSVSNFFIILFKTLIYSLKITVVHTGEYNLEYNCQCNVFWSCVAIIIAAGITKDWSYRNNCGFWLHVGDLEHSLMKEKNRSSYVFLLIFMFCYSRFRFRSLKDANSCMFSWCITTRSLLICSWHDMTLSQFVQ